MPPGTSTGHSGLSEERYIEVSTDERYCVEVKLLPEFEFLGHAGAEMSFSLDNRIFARHIMDRQTDPVCAHPAGCNPHEFVLSTVSWQYAHCEMTFGQLERGLWPCFLASCHLAQTDDCTDEDIELNRRRRAGVSDALGCITVNIQRGERGLELECRRPPDRIRTPAIPDMAICEEVVDQYHLSHATK